MEWTAFSAAGPAAEGLTPPGMWLLLAGELCCTVGLSFCGLQRFAHAARHLFVPVGSAIHEICIFRYCIL